MKTKSQLRKIYLDKRKALTLQEVEEQSKKIVEQIKKYFPLIKMKNIHIFLPIKKMNEVNTQYWIKELWEDGKRVFIPKILDGKMYCYELTPHTTLEESSWGILEPKGEPISEIIKFDMVVTPLLYCDAEGNRVGYGKGFYDQFFTEINADAIKVGVNFFTPKEEIIDVFSGDIPLDYLVTSDSVFSFKSKSTK